jgi:hypothetical protein
MATLPDSGSPATTESQRAATSTCCKQQTAIEETRAAENEAVPTATAAIGYHPNAASARYDGEYVTRIEEQLAADNGAS